MRLQSLRSKLLMAVSVLAALVIGSGLLISLLVTHRYGRSVFKTATAQGENLAHAVALEAADRILINDLVALQKMLDHQMRSNPSVAYLFVIRDEKVVAHTFTGGVPVQLLKANGITSGEQTHLQRIASTSGEHYLDIAWPIFSGKAGVLRLGLSEKPYRQQVTELWLQISALSLGILLLALAASLLFIKRITWPLAALAEAAEKIDEGNDLDLKVEPKGYDEVGKLTSSFNHMVARIKEHTQELEDKTIELARAHRLTRSSFVIVQEIGALSDLNEIGSFLINKFQDILKFSQMVLLIFNGNRDLLFTLSARGIKALKEPATTQTAMAVLESMKKVTLTKRIIFKPPLVPDDFQEAACQAIVPLHHENKLLGALVIACPEDRCNVKEVDAVGMILTQTAGVIKRAVLREQEIRDLKSPIESIAEFSGIIGKDPKMQVIYNLIEDTAPTDTTILIQGESGTGKELVARAIHQRSPRKDKPFIVINCSAYPATLLESELFGHEKGAFTGAIRQKAGRFEQAHGGTVFLDEIGEIPPSAQIKLLRVLQTKKFERLGGEKTLAVDVRILAATNKDLLQEVKNGHFREDLFYRLNVIPIHLPPLRERHNDIPLLAHHFLRHFAPEQGKKNGKFSPETMQLLLDYPWPGNVRELENSIEHASVLTKDDRIEASHLPSALRDAYSSTPTGSHRTILENERILLKEALEESCWNKKQAAQRLGISRSSFYDKLKKHHISSRPTTH
jgi:two-component system response regulator HydG